VEQLDWIFYGVSTVEPSLTATKYWSLVTRLKLERLGSPRIKWLPWYLQFYTVSNRDYQLLIKTVPGRTVVYVIKTVYFKTSIFDEVYTIENKKRSARQNGLW